MSVKLHGRKPDETIPVREMADGDIAVVTEWRDEQCVGWIVTRYKESLVAIGKEGLDGWEGLWSDGKCRLQDKYRVRILQPGELIEVT